MEYILVVTVIICTYLIIKTIREHSPEGQNKKLLNKIGSYKDRVTFIRDEILKKEPDLIECEDLQELRVILVEMDDKYHHLVGQNKNDYKKILELTEDWNDYLTALHSLKMARCKLGVDLTNETAENYGELTAEPSRKKEEVEKKFSKLLK